MLVLAMSYLLTWFAAKIYRVGVLLYGKRPSVREIVRLMRTTEPQRTSKREAVHTRPPFSSSTDCCSHSL